MNVLVTGCGGFLGSEIVRQLLARGDDVVGISRSACPGLVQRGMVHRRGDLTDNAFLREAVRGVDAVVHTAAKAGVWGSWQQFFRINTQATREIISACQRSSIATLVFTSSPSVTFDGSHQSGVDETVPYPNRWLFAYPQTKAMAEQQVLAAHRPGVLHCCALRPHLIWGNDDPHLLPRVVQRARRGRLRIVGDGQNRIDTVHVINAASAHLDALDAMQSNVDAAGGRAYFITQGEPVNCWRWIQQICELAGVSPPTKRISYSTALAVGAALEATYRVTGRTSEPPMTRFIAGQLARDHFFDITAAKQRLGYRAGVSTADGLAMLREDGQRWTGSR